MSALLDSLRAPFESADLEWRSIYTRAGKGDKPPLILVTPYVNRPALLNRLNQVCGLEGWQSDARVSAGHVYMGIGICTGTNPERWAWRWDGTGFLFGDPDPKAHFTPSDAGKGDFSNAFKRCCEQFGIAGYLRELKPMRAILDSEGRYKSTVDGHGVQRWNPPPIQGTPSYPGEIPGWAATEGGPPPEEETAGDDPTNGVRQPVEPPTMTDGQKTALIQEHKDKVRAFMVKHGYRTYHLDGIVALHSELKVRYANGAKLGQNGSVDDWAIMELLTRRNVTRWDECQRELAKEFPTAPERLQVLDALLDQHKLTGQDLIVVNTAKDEGWNDAVEWWINDLGKR